MTKTEKSRISSQVVIALLLSLVYLFVPNPKTDTTASANQTTTCLSSDFASGSGDGTSWEEAFKISSREHLFQLNYCTTSTYDNLHFELVNDIDLRASDPNATWSPIGLIRNNSFINSTSIFFGNLNGNGFEIKNMYVDISNPGNSFSVLTDQSRYAGLFRTLERAEIKNLRISGSVTADGDAGMLAGFSYRGNSVSDIAVSANVYSVFRNAGGIVPQDANDGRSSFSGLVVNKFTANSKIRGALYVGGVFGLASNANIKNVYAEIDVFSDSIGRTVPNSETAQAGGIIGTGSGVSIDSAFFRGQVSVTRDTSGAPTFEYVGGAFGRLDSTSSVNAVVALADVEGNQVVGGLAGWIRATQISNSIFSGEVTGIGSTESHRIGGLVGELSGTSTNQNVLKNSVAYGTVACAANCPTANTSLGGFVGYLGANAVIEDVQSETSIEASSAVNYLGGFGGSAQFSSALRITISRVVVVGSISYSATPTRVGGLFGELPTGTNNPVRSYSDLFFSSSGLVDDDTGNNATVFGTSLSPAAFADIQSFTAGNGWSIQAANSSTPSTWRMCDYPVLSAGILPAGCLGPAPTVSTNPDSGVELTPDFGTSEGGTLVTVRGKNLSSVTGVLFANNPGTGFFAAGEMLYVLTPPGSGTANVDLELPGANILPLTDQFTYTSLGPAASVSSTVTPSSIVFQVECTGVCVSNIPDSYSITVTPSGGGASQTLLNQTSLTGLTGNTSYDVEVVVESGGLFSPALSHSITTPKPIATISAISVLDTSATLTVGCTNCGSAPDSFTVSATPVAGGAPITSNTNVISGLSPETTYSFSVVVAFAGTTSDLVLWQDNPVMTLPLIPVITAVSPAAVPLTGGTITVTGSNFTTSSLLTLDGASLAFTIVSGTEITFTAPSDTAGSYDLAITNPVGTFALSSAITYVSGPTLTTNSPVLATTNGGTIVSLIGTDLSTTTQVNVGSTTVSFSVVSNTVVRFTTAATSAGIVEIGVVTVGGADTLSNAIEFTTSALVPVVTSITPTSGTKAGGTTITVTGQYFSGSYSDSVSAAINGISGSSVILIDDSTLTFVSPAGAAASGLDVSVATGGGVGTLAGAFTYTAPPAPSSGGSGGPAIVLNTPEILLFSTREIEASGGEVTATGRRLADISVLTLGGIAVTLVSNTDTSVTFTTGEMPVGVWDLRLVGSNGTLVFQQAIEVVEATAIVAESTGQLLGYTWTLKFLGNSRSLHDAQAAHLSRRLNPDAQTIICWGYTTAANPKAWAIAHATQRAQAACDFASANQGNVKTVVRLRYGVSKDYAMRSALQFWK